MRESKIYFILDRYLGTFLCFILSIIPLTFRLFMKKKKGAKLAQVPVQGKILIIELFEMGSSLMFYPTLFKNLNQGLIRKENLYCLCTKSTEESWKLIGLIPNDNIFTISSKSFSNFIQGSFFSILSLSIKKRIIFDLIMDLSPFTRIASLLSCFILHKNLSGFTNKGGEGYFRGFHYNLKVPYSQNLHTLYNFENLFEIAMGLSEELVLKQSKSFDLNQIKIPLYESQEKIREKIFRKIPLQPLFLIGPDVGPNLSQRNYPKEQYAKLIGSILLKFKDVHILLIGTKNNFQYCEEIKEMILLNSSLNGEEKKRLINFSGETENLEELLELFHLSSFYIGNDNGLQHFASMTPIPFISLFGVESPRIYGPLGNGVAMFENFGCSPCVSFYNQKSCTCQNNLCLKRIKVENILHTMEIILEGKGKARSINNKESYLNDSTLQEIKVMPHSLEFSLRKASSFKFF